ncbi:hypothetical protein [Frigoribacterium sp. PhB118]|uniref:hypothetical protein n=1 Tax=Frigoribacterium sp. PhB118 TaxID=2485175 RepID=UPI0011CD3DFD|nr:hypothetical protein [Frigoribacterium sp. PhB118]
MLAEGIVRESGRVASGGGKLRTLVEINPGALYAVGVQLGYEWMTFVATGVGGGIVARQLVDGASLDSPEEVTDRFVAQFDAFVPTPASPGCRSPGSRSLPPAPYRRTTAPSSDRRRRVDGKASRSGTNSRNASTCPVLIDNDAAAAAVGEFWTRRIPRTKTFASI